MIGHANGVITIDVAESDDVRRERIRAELGEPYRTMLGHLRHEVGHFIQQRLVTGDRLARYRELFGDETMDYQSEIDRHYAEGPPDGWASSYLSAYATMHPFEDFAETFAHYLHISDTCETAAEQGLIAVDLVPHGRFRDLVIGVWVPLSIASEPDQPEHGQGRSLPVRHPRTGARQARLRRPPRVCGQRRHAMIPGVAAVDSTGGSLLPGAMRCPTRTSPRPLPGGTPTARVASAGGTAPSGPSTPSRRLLPLLRPRRGSGCSGCAGGAVGPRR